MDVENDRCINSNFKTAELDKPIASLQNIK